MESTSSRCLNIEVGIHIRDEIGEGLTRRDGGNARLGNARGLERFLDSRISSEGPSLLSQDQVGAHVGRGGNPHILRAFRTRWLVVEVTRALVSRRLK